MWSTKRLCLGFVLVSLSVSGVLGALLTEVSYSIDAVGAGRWRYTYTIKNIGLIPPIKFLTIYFPYGSVNLGIETPSALQPYFEEMVTDSPWGGRGGIPIEGYYDIMTEYSQISPFMSIAGFSVSFDWRGDGAPGRQYYEVFDPETFEVLASGWTVPEPMLLLLLGTGGLLLSRRRQR